MKPAKHWRLGQTLFNFQHWLEKKGIDMFYVDDVLFKKYYKEYLKSLEVTYETDEI